MIRVVDKMQRYGSFLLPLQQTAATRYPRFAMFFQIMTTPYHDRRRLIVYMTTLIAGVAITTSSCSDDKMNVGTGSGRIRPSVTVDRSIIPAVDPQHIIELTDVPDGDLMRIKLIDNSFSSSSAWENLSQMQTSEVFLPGQYTIQAYSGTYEQEGFDCPYFFGSTDFTLHNGQTATPQIDCALSNTIIEIEYTEAYRSMFADYSVVIHSDGGQYITYSSTEQRRAFLKPGNISFTLNIEMADGRKASFQPVKVSDAKARYLYHATLDAIEATATTPAKIVISFDDKVLTDDVTISLNDAFFNADTPLIDPVGFNPGMPLHLSEGADPEEKIAYKVYSDDLSALTLTLAGADFGEEFPTEIDLLNLSAQEADAIKRMGIDVSGLAPGLNNGSEIDMTRMLSCLRYNPDSPEARFTLQARNRSSKVSQPVTLACIVEPVDLTVISISPAVVGINRAEIRVKCPSTAINKNVELQALDSKNHWDNLNIYQIESLGSSTYAIRFDVPDGNDTDIDVRIIYFDQVKEQFKIKRESPAFTIKVDPYALFAIVRFEAENPDLRSLITSCASVYASGRQLMNLDRFSDLGYIIVSGLAQSTRYSFSASVMRNPTAEQMCPAVEVTTETCVQLPNSDFEDVRNTIDYHDMLSGGRYSQTVVGIFNLQNRATFSLSTPRYWANVNEKTFCPGATNHNTWYMAPSAYTVTDAHQGAYAVRLDNVGWDLDGQIIPDYRQTGQPYTSYSLNVPNIAHRASGRLFLGSYSFDPMTCTETYNEGVRINSRPSTVNGYYKYVPSLNNTSDKGIVKVEVTGLVDDVETVIASGQAYLTTSLSYKAFAVPLTYNCFDVKAHHIKIMFAGSASMGDIASETANVITYNNPVTSTSRGSSLWIDDINLSY